jgi:cytoskeletal protein CcmA (bactofilin family)
MATVKELDGLKGGKSTIIGESILVNGKLTGDEDLTVQGRVEGEVNLTKALIVEPSGVVKANVTVRNAIISGTVVGNVQATDSVELTREGRMVGDIAAPRVILADGASFRGRVEMGDVDIAAGERTSRTARTPSRSASSSRPPPPPPLRSNSSHHKESRSDKPHPPAPAVVLAGSKKRVIIKKRAR